MPVGKTRRAQVRHRALYVGPAVVGPGRRSGTTVAHPGTAPAPSGVWSAPVADGAAHLAAVSDTQVATRTGLGDVPAGCRCTDVGTGAVLRRLDRGRPGRRAPGP